MHFRKYWALYAGLSILWLTSIILIYLILDNNNGHFTYVVDDAYIHMAMAKNFALHGIWGLDKYNFASASSSPLWTLLLSAIYWLFGIHTIAPLILNIFFASLILLSVHALLKKYYANQWIIFLSLLAVIFLTPLPAVMFTGMEHVLHSLLVILLVNQSAKILSNENNSQLNNYWLLILAAMTMSARYESIFIIFTICLLFFLRKKIVDAVMIALAAFAPVILYGAISIWHGSFFLPNSVLLKGSGQSIYANIIQFIASPARNNFLPLSYELFRAPYILIPVLLSLFLLIANHKKNKNIFQRDNIVGVIFIFSSLLHLIFISTGWFYRYEAYLMTLGIFSFFAILKNLIQETKKFFAEMNALLVSILLVSIMTLIIILPIADRGVMSIIKTPTASANIYEQQYQIGRFLNKFYRDQEIALNDIGLASYLGEIKLLDLLGLGSIEVAQAILKNNFDSKYIHSIAESKNVKIAIVYDAWFRTDNMVPKQWKKVGEWTIAKNVVCGGDTVSFYAVNIAEEKNLIKNLRIFSNELPKNITQKGAYINSKL